MPLDPNPAPMPDTPSVITDISFFGKGAIVTPDDVSSTHYSLAATPPTVIDWNIPFRVAATLVQKNQDGSSSCTAQATNYYVQALNQIEHGVSELYSSRWIYSQTSLGYGQGTYIWRAMGIPISMGAADLNSVPDNIETEAWMLDKSDNPHAILEAKTDKFATISRQNQGIDFMAQIIKDYHGFVTGFNGWNGMFAPDGTVIDWSKSDWGHSVYVCGYEVRNGQKCLVFKNSWGANWGDGGYGYFPEAFVTSNMMFDAYVYATIADLDPNSVILTNKQVQELQALEGYLDPAGATFWTGKLLSDYLAARLPDKIKTINNSLNIVGADILPLPVPVVSSMNNLLTLGDAGSLLIGAGLAKLADSLNVGLILIGAGAGLKILVAVLQKFGVPVSANQ